MGNSSSQILERVNALNEEGLKSSWKGDQEIIDYNDELYDHGRIGSLIGLDQYEIPGSSFAKPPPPGKSAEQEVAMALSMINPHRFSEKHSDVKQTLQLDILANRSQDPTSGEKINRLRAICYMHEALLREEKRFKNMSKQEDSQSKKKEQLPGTAKLAIKWGIRTLVSLIECVGPQNPAIYGMILDQTSEILQQFPAGALQSDEPTISEAIGIATKFFGRVLNGEYREIPEEQQLKSISPLLGLATATGSLSSLLSIVTKFIKTPQSADFLPTASILQPLLNQLYNSSGAVQEDYNPPKWSANHKRADMVISGEDRIVTRTDSSGWGTILSVEVFESGIVYHEVKINTNSSDCLYIGVSDANYNDFSSTYNSSFVSFAYQVAGGVVNNQGNSQASLIRLQQGDTLGILINMDEKNVTFYRNKVKQAHDPFGPLPEKVRLFATFGGSSQFIQIQTEFERPEDVEDLIGSLKNGSEDQSNEPKNQAEHTRFQSIKQAHAADVNPEEITPSLASVFILACIDKLNIGIRQQLETNKKYKCKRKNGLSLDVELTTIEGLLNVFKQLKQHYIAGDFSVLDKEMSVIAITCIIRVLRAHLLASKQFQSIEIPFDSRQQLYNDIEHFMDNCDDKNIGEELATTLSTCFEIFFEKANEKLQYLIDRLDELRQNKDLSEVKIQLQNKMFTKLAEAEILYPAFDLEDDQNFERVQNFLSILVELMGTYSVKGIETGYNNMGLVNLMHASQKCFLSQAAKSDFQGKCQGLLFEYINGVLQISSMIMTHFTRIYKTNAITDEILERIKHTVLYTVLPNLLNALMITKLNLDLITSLLPYIQDFASILSQVQGPAPKLVNGIGQVKEVYESDHNYPDYANQTHEIKIPNASKYVLTFDPQCKTENGCDYLELWKDSTKNERLYRWEGENFPKQPVVIENPQLYFTFHSDGSVNYWGWKIDIIAYTELQYFKREWPDHLKEACRALIAAMAHKLISGEFEMQQEDEEVTKLLNNPLLKFGVKDKVHCLVKELSPLPDGLVGLTNTPGLYRAKSSIAQRIAQEETKKKLLISEAAQAVSLPTYVANYGVDADMQYSDIDFINRFIEGEDSIVESWGKLKVKSGVVGPSATTGGADLDKAERAIFAVYIAFFEMSDTISKIVEDTNVEISPTLKYIIKQSCTIRTWAQQFRQKSIDEKDEKTYAQISENVVKKCAFLLHSEYKLSLNDMGLKNIMFNLITTVVRAQSSGGATMKAGSKWMAVRKAMKTMSLLRNLLGVKKRFVRKAAEESNKEFNQISDIVKQFLESHCPVEKLVEAMEKRRTRALARALGFQSLAQMLSVSQGMETSLIRSFSDSMRKKNGKMHYWDGLEGADPYLLSCVKSCFFKVYELLQKDLVMSSKRELDWMYLHHYLTLTEAMSYPFRDIDSHMMLELNIQEGLKNLLKVAKGYIGVETDLVEFDDKKPITHLTLKKKGEQGTENTVLIRSFEPQEEEKKAEVEEENKSDNGEQEQAQVCNELYVEFTQGPPGQPLAEALLTNEVLEGYEVLSGPVQFEDKDWYIIGKFSEPSPGKEFVTGVKEQFEIVKEPYEKLMRGYDEAQLEKFNDLKQKLRKSAWSLFKLVLFGTSGAPEVISESKKILVQEMMMSVVDEELQWNLQFKKPDEGSIDLQVISSADNWMASRVDIYNIKKNPMTEWVRQFRSQTEDMGDEVLIRDLIDSYVNNADPAMQGEITEEQLQELGDEIKSTLQNAGVINDKGNYDFFKYLNIIKGNSESFTHESIEFIQNSYLFRELPKDITQAEEEFNITEPATVIKVALKRFLTEDSQSKTLLERLRDAEVPGIDNVQENEPTPESFRNEEGKVDLYKALNEIKKNKQEHSTWYEQLQNFLEMYNDLPPSVEFIRKKKQQPFDFLGSMLWTVYESCGSWCLSKVLSRPARIAELFKHMLMTGSEKTSVLSSRILRHVVPSQHSPQTIALIWDSLETKRITYGLSQNARKSLVHALFGLIGVRKTWLYRSTVLKNLERWELEAHDFLRSLINEERWKEEIISVMLEELGNLGADISSGQTPSDVAIGAINFFSASIPEHQINLSQNLVWTRVKLSDSTIDSGTIKYITGTDVVVYSEEDDSVVTENQKKVSNVLLYTGTQFLKELSQEESMNLICLMSNIIPALDHHKIISKVEAKKKAGLIAIYKDLNAHLLNSISYLTNAIDQLPAHFIDDVMRPLIRNMTDIKDQYLSKVFAKCESKVSQKLSEQKEDNKKEEEQMTEDQARELLAQMSEEDQVHAMELASLDINIVQIVKAFQADIKDEEGVRNYSEAKKEETTKIFKLKKTDDSSIDTIDPTSEAMAYQNKKGHIIIQSKTTEHERIIVTQELSNKIYRELSNFPNEITIQLAVGAIANSKFGAMLGELEILFNETGDQTEITIDGHQATIQRCPIYAFRLFVRSNGDIQFIGDNFKHAAQLKNNTVFDGIQISKYGVFTDRGTRAILQGLEIYLGHQTNITQFWSDEDKEEFGGQFIKPNVSHTDPNKFRLKLTGAPGELIKGFQAQSSKLTENVRMLVESGNAQSWKTSFSHQFEAPIVDVKLINPGDSLGADWELVPIYRNGVRQAFEIPNRKILAIKRHYSLGLPSQYISGIAIAESRQDYVQLDNLTISAEGDYSNNVYISKGTKETRGAVLRGLSLVVVDNLNNVALPVGYKLIQNKENESVNLAPKGTKDYFVFLAYSDFVTILGCPITPLPTLMQSGQSTGNQGMVNDFQESGGKKKKGYVVKEMSILELVLKMRELRDAEIQQASQKLIVNLLKKNPEILNQLLETESLNKILLILRNQIELLENSIDQAIEQNNTQLNLNIIQEIVLQFIINTYKPGSGASLPERHIESKHPYDNNLDVDDTISIPGAQRLRIEFDPQCHTESGCDPLRFYARPSRQEEIKCLSGQGESTWQSFDHEGDTIYTYFHTDGSVVYWGYKFKVIPIGSQASVDDPYSSMQNPEAAIWLLERLVNKADLNNGLEQLMEKNVLIPLFLFIHSGQSIELTQRALIILKKLLRGQNYPEIQSMFRLLIDQAVELNEQQKKEKGYNPILQAIILLLADHAQRYNIVLNDDWFTEFCNAYHDMDALYKKDKQLNSFIFERFIAKNEIIPKQEFSLNKYPSSVKVDHYQFQGAQSLKVNFQEETKLPKGNTVFLSNDPDGRDPVETRQVVKSLNVIWADSPIGPDINRSDNNLRVTRTDSSNWGNVLMSQSFNKGIVRVTYFIENDGDSSYLYIGVFATANEYPMSTCIGSDCGHKVWSWKKTGEFHRNGEQSSRSEGSFATGDTIILELNLDSKMMTCIKNDNPVYTFNDIEGDVRPVICFGGDNQFVVIRSVEQISGGQSAQLNAKSVVSQSNEIYIHYPVNEGYLEQFSWKNVPSNSNISDDFRDLNIGGEQDNTRVHLSPSFNSGRHYAEVYFKETATQEVSFFLLRGDSNIGEATVEMNQEDRIGLLADLWANKFSVFKNGAVVQETQVEFTDDYHNFAINITNSEGNSKVLSLTEKPVIPEGIDLYSCPKPVSRNFLQLAGSMLGLGQSEQSQEQETEFMLKFVVTPVFPSRNDAVVDALRNFMTEEQKELWSKEYENKYVTYFKSGAAEELVQFLDELCRNRGYSVMELNDEQLNPEEKDLIYFKQLERVPVEEIRELYQILKIFNNNVNNILPLLDLHIENRNKMTMIQKSFVGSRCYIFDELKKKQFNDFISKTNVDSRASITIDRPKAARHKQRGVVDSQAQFSIFGQIFRLMNNKPNREFRNSERIYTVEYRGEGSTDAGGPYNESISNMTDELQSSFLKLLIPSPNQTYNIGDYRGSWIPNPQANSKLDYELYTYLGKWFGVAIRTQNNLNLSFPPLFWKKLMLEEVNVMDLKAFDETVYQILNILRNLESQNITPDTFGMAFDEFFTTTDSSGATVELIPGGSEIRVTFENAGQYADCIERARLNECTEVYQAIRKGMSAIVPIDLLNLFSWKQVETLVCGAPDIDIDILMENTDYEGCQASDQHIRFFWEVLREFSPKERSLFLKFVWGRSKLPAGKNFRHMKVTRYNPSGNVDNYLPISHTCFFTIDLPAYTNKQSMHNKLLYAVTHCTAIDLDHGAGAGWEEDEE